MIKQLVLSMLCIGSMSFANAQLFHALACKINAEAPTPLGSAQNLNPKVLSLALKAYSCAQALGYKDPHHLITIIDYTLPSTQKRLWVIDLQTKQVLFNTLVAQGKYTGGLMARYFSDQPQSKKSSLGLFMTQEPYIGHDGFSLRINGLEPGFNDKAESREIVIHGAWYVSESFARRVGRIGLSWGCPAVPKDEVKPIIDKIRDGTFLFSYYPDPTWLAKSKFLHCPVNNGKTYSELWRTLTPSIYSNKTVGI